MVSATGANTRLAYDYQSEFGPNRSLDGSGTTFIPFGSNATMETWEGSHQAVRVFQPNDREAAQIIEQMFDGSFSVNFDLTNPWWIESVISADDTDSPSAGPPFTYDWNGDNAATQVPRPFSIFRTVDKSSYSSNAVIDVERQAADCVVATCSGTVDVGGNVNITLTGAYANEDTQSPTLTSQPTIDYRTMTFAEGTVTTNADQSGTQVSRVQTASWNISNNVDMVGELGSKVAVDYSPKARNADVDYTKIAQDDTELARFYGNSPGSGTTTSVGSAIDNGYQIDLDFVEAAGDQNELTLSFFGNFPDQYTESGIGDPQADLENELSEMSTSVSAVATTANEIPTAP